MTKNNLFSFALVLAIPMMLFSQPFLAPSFGEHFEQSRYQNQVHRMALSSPSILTNPGNDTLSDEEPKTPLLEELGYIAAQQVVFVGLSYLSSRKEGYAPLVATGFDVMMGTAGLLNISHQEKTIQKIGHLAVSTGFFAKSYYTMRGGASQSEKTRFWTSYLSYSALVYLGYYLDTL